MEDFIDLIVEGIKWIRMAYVNYTDETPILFVVLLSNIFLIYGIDRRKRQYVYSIIVIYLFVFCPIFIYVLEEYRILASNRVPRIFWLVPVCFIIAWTCTVLVNKFKGVKQYVVCVLVVILIILTGNYTFTNENYVKADNWYKIDNDIITIVDIILEDNGGDDNIKILAPIEMSAYIRTYNGNIKLEYGRSRIYQNGESEYLKKAYSLGEAMKADEIDVRFIFDLAPIDKCDYVVLDGNKVWINEEYGNYHVIGTYKQYVIFKNSN